MVILFTYKDPKTGILHADYGYDVNTDKKIVLPQVPIFYFKHRFDKDVGEYMLIENESL